MYLDERKEMAFTVKVFFTPSRWLDSLEQLVEVSVRCVVSRNDRTKAVRIDLASALCPLPREFSTPKLEGGVKNLRWAFREALRSAVERHLGRPVSQVAWDRVDWMKSDAAEGGP